MGRLTAIEREKDRVAVYILLFCVTFHSVVCCIIDRSFCLISCHGIVFTSSYKAMLIYHVAIIHRTTASHTLKFIVTVIDCTTK